MGAPARIEALSAAPGCDQADAMFLDVIDRAHTALDEAEKLFDAGMRVAGLAKLGEAAGYLEAVQ